MTKTNAATLALFLKTGRIIRARMERVLPLSFGQCEALRLVGEREGLAMRDIARHFKITAPSATSLVQELVRGGCLARRAGTRDRRQVHLALTRKGSAALRLAEARRTKVLSDVLRVLTERDRRQLNTILEKIIGAN